MPSREPDAPIITLSSPPPQSPDKENAARQYSSQAERLALDSSKPGSNGTANTQAAEAKFVTPLDPVIETTNGGRLPVVPIHEAERLNELKANAEGRDPRREDHLLAAGPFRTGKDGTPYGMRLDPQSAQSEKAGAPLRNAIPPS